MEERRSHVVEDRIAKLNALREQGVEPFAYSYDVTHHTTEAKREFEASEGSAARMGASEGAAPGSTVRVAGRITAMRTHGKTTFADLSDREGKLQLYLRQADLGVESFGRLPLLDLGDWVGAEGTLMRTRMGEVTLQVSAWELLAKGVRPLPFGKEEVDEATGEKRQYGGFTDVEQRYRQRYADLAVNTDVRDVFIRRARIVSTIRRFLDARDYIEVETPVLQPLYGGANARPFTTHHNALDMPLYLRIADELYLKRLIVGGLERVYEISKDFRNEGIDRTHSPEFTMLEFYQAFADYEDMMQLVEEMIADVVRSLAPDSMRLQFEDSEIDFTPPYRRIRFMDALSEAGGFDAKAASDAELLVHAKKFHVENAAGMNRPQLLDELFKNYVEPTLVQPVFVIDHPRELSPLAKPHRSDPTLVERFELMVAGREVANAFSELNDPFDQRERFEAQMGLRAGGDDEAQQLDEDYLRAMEYGMPPTGGVGIGIDRLVMLLTNQPSIRDVVLFPTMRMETTGESAE